MTAFVPPFPPRPARKLSSFELIRRARRNFLEMFDEGAFRRQLTVTRLFNKQVFLCNAPDLVQFAFSTHNASFERKSPQMRHALAPVAGDGLIISDGATWKTRRKLVGPIIHVSRLRDFAPVMVETAIEMRDRWAALPEGSTLDILPEMAELTAEVITRTVFGRALGPDRARAVVDGFTAYQHRVGRMDLLSLVGLPDWFPRLRHPGLKAATRRIHDVLDEIIAGIAVGEGGAETSIVRRLLDARDEETGEPLSREAIRNEAAVMFLAGHETTANTMSWVWYLQSQMPEIEARLHDELDTVLGGRSPTLADIPDLPYTRAVIEETLRLYPSIPILAREAVADEEVRGKRIPKGSIVMVVPWLLHRHRYLWNEPDAFRAERFLPGSAEPISKFAYIPFSIGPRICAGMSFGLTEAMLCLATLAQSFRLELQPGHVVEPICRLTLRPGDTLPMRLVRRDAVPRRAEPAAAAPACPHLAAEGRA